MKRRGKIKNLLFDMGGVIVDLDRNRCLQALLDIGLEDADNLIGLYIQEGVFADLEAGQISAADFRAEVHKDLPPEVTDEQLDAAFSSFIVGIPRRRLECLRQLRKRYGVYLLSNTNPIMYEGILAELFKQEGLTVDDYFDGITVSYKAGCSKPYRGIFDYAVETMGIVPEETLFLDDGPDNIEAARQLGFNALLVPPGTEFEDLLKSYL